MSVELEKYTLLLKLVVYEISTLKVYASWCRPCVCVSM